MISLVSMFIVLNTFAAQTQIAEKRLPDYVRILSEANLSGNYICEIFGGLIGDTFISYINSGVIKSDRTIVLTYDGPSTTYSKYDFILNLSDDAKSIDSIKVDYYQYRSINTGDILKPDFQVLPILANSDTCLKEK